MDISSAISNNCATITVSGMLDTLNAEKLIQELEALPEDAHSIEFNFEAVTYISSAGLRALLTAAKIAEKRGGTMTVVKVGEFVREIFATVGFDRYLR